MSFFKKTFQYYGRPLISFEIKPEVEVEAESELKLALILNLN